MGMWWFHTNAIAIIIISSFEFIMIMSCLFLEGSAIWGGLAALPVAAEQQPAVYWQMSNTKRATIFFEKRVIEKCQNRHLPHVALSWVVVWAKALNLAPPTNKQHNYISKGAHWNNIPNKGDEVPIRPPVVALTWNLNLFWFSSECI